MPDAVLLRTERLTRAYGSLLAVSDVDVSVQRGELRSIIGPNGAGKTTFFRLISGETMPTSGRIWFNGADITGVPQHATARLGFAKSYQITNVFPHLSVLENVRVAVQRQRGDSFDFWRPATVLRGLNERSVALLDAVGLTPWAGILAGELPYGRKRALEIATTLALEPEMMLLDEPTSGMTAEDVLRIADLIRRASAGRTVLMVEHNLSVVSRLSDRITVLARGEVLAEGNYEQVSRDPRVVEAYIGTGHA